MPDHLLSVINIFYLHTYQLTISTQIERHCCNFRPGFFGAVAFKFEPNLTVVIKYLPPNSGLLFKQLASAALRDRLQMTSPPRGEGGLPKGDLK